jgi:hypothetical protein
MDELIKMTQLAKPVVKNKFWIVEEDGRKIGTIQAVDDGVIYIHGQQKEKFSTFKLLSKKYNISVGRSDRKTKHSVDTIYDYPCEGPVYNPIYDLKLRLPLYTKETKSKSYYCAGYYRVKLEDSSWVTMFCPKKIILSRHENRGPFKTKDC